MGRISLPKFSFHSRDAVWDKEIKVVSEHTRFVLQTSASISLTLNFLSMERCTCSKVYISIKVMEAPG